MGQSWRVPRVQFPSVPQDPRGGNVESEEIDVDDGMAPMGPMGREVLMIGGARGGGGVLTSCHCH